VEELSEEKLLERIKEILSRTRKKDGK